jgi:predicted MPP superfamily phosphohydrolase
MSRPLRIAFASDFHAGPATDPALLTAAVVALGEVQPDVLLLGGDYVTGDGSEAASIARALGQVPAPYGRFAVLGNHDWWCGAESITRSLESSGIEVLTNRRVTLASPFDRVSVCGLDDHWLGRPDAGTALDGAEGFRIVLMHAPSGLLDVGDRPFDLALCGHTHGGQIALPGGKPILVPNGSLSRRYARGRFELDGACTLIVSLGVGCVLVPFRLFSDSEIHLIEVIPQGEPKEPSA